MPSEPVPDSTMQIGPLALLLRQRTEEEIDRQAQAARVRVGSRSCSLPCTKSHISARRDHVGAVGVHGHAILDPVDRHPGEPLDQLDQQAIMVRIEMLHNDKRHGAFWARGQCREEGFDGGQTTCGSADADDRKIRGAGCRSNACPPAGRQTAPLLIPAPQAAHRTPDPCPSCFLSLPHAAG